MSYFYERDFSTARETLDSQERLPVNTHECKNKSRARPKKHMTNFVLEIRRSFSGRLNYSEKQCPTRPPSLEIFQCIFREYPRLRFSEDAFEVEDLNAPHYPFAHHLEIGHLFLDRCPEVIPSLFNLYNGAQYEVYYS